MADARPAVSIVVPFLGGREEAERLAETLEGLALRDGDEVIVADNTEAGTFAATARGTRIATVRSTGEHSSYHSRNVGADAARNDWLLFLDADCRPRPDIADRFFDEPIDARVGAIAGAVPPLRRGDGRMARYEESRSQDKQALHIANPYRPFGVTANLLVRRAAWEEVGGFQEGVRSSGDADFCWRIQDAGWTIAYRAEAQARHLLREGLRPYLRLHARYGAGRRWLHLRHPRAPLGPRPRNVLRNAAGAVILPLAGKPERGLFKAIDVAVTLSETAGYTLGNSGRRWPRAPRGGPRIALLADRFPKPSETFVVNEARALAELGADVEVIARSRPGRPALGATWELPVRYLEDAGILREGLDLGWLAARHPLRCASDIVARRRWRREETVAPLRVLAPLARGLARERFDHVHVHFARRAALDALRVERLLGIPFSVTPHAWDIFRETSNLPEKIESAAFTTSGCNYNVEYLRTLVRAEARERIHKIVMGVDPSLLERTEPYAGNGTVLAIGRLVEKKGFGHLIDAAARLRDFDGLDEVVVVGDGPLRAELEERARSQGLDGLVRFAGAKRFDEVRAAIQGAALLAMPAVVAADGDRDSMPVVVKEALAMGVPVVATDEVGLPEVVRGEWGRLVPPADPDALAAAIRELLELGREERAAMGERGRDFVLGEFTVAKQTAKLLELIARR
jgi:colanic acid/amylovoran biosynthesis glycosyltransferase